MKCACARCGVALLLAVALSACTASETAKTYQGPSGSQVAMKMGVLQAIGGRLAYCDPDYYPVGTAGSPYEHARDTVSRLQQDPESYLAVVDAMGVESGQELTRQQTIDVAETWKQINTIQLKPAGGGAFAFVVFVPTTEDATGPNRALVGTVTTDGVVTVHPSDATPAYPSNADALVCPVCLARGQMIATPKGHVAIEYLSVGDRVWSTDATGQRIAATVLETGHMDVRVSHEVVGVELADGRYFEASPGHPTADGRMVGSLRRGDRLDGSAVTDVRSIPYPGTTYDILPSGPTGTYFVNGILVGSTLLRS